MKFKLLFLVFVNIIFIACSKPDYTKISLSGKWQFKVDSLDIGISEKWFNHDFAESIILPGSMAENGKGNDISVHTRWTGQIVDSSWYKDQRYEEYRKAGNIKIPFWLQPVKHYVGPAWYKRNISIPESWDGKKIELLLERCHWESRVWIDGTEIGKQNYLASPHIFNLPQYLTSGNHSLVIRIDNRIKEIDPGINAHSISDHTQTNWNGIVGEIALIAKSPVYFEQVRLFPDISERIVKVRLNLKNETNKELQYKLSLAAENSEHKPDKLIKELNVMEDETIEIEYPMGDDHLLWDEFNPNIYTMNITIETPEGTFSQAVDFGMREIKVNGTQIEINNRPLFLRGTLECAIFPLTGYPPTEVSEWERIFRIIKDHGLNHMRFHSWCPPKAAFSAADKVGIYLQVESSAWANIGNGEPIDNWLYKEAESILNTYGNHPSFCFMAYGNEPSGPNQVEYLNEFVTHWKNKDPRRLYTAAAGWPSVMSMDYYNTYEPRIQLWGAGLNSIINNISPQTLFDFSDILKSKFNDKPSISHEIGQWCVYPNFKEIEKYTGVLKAKNFEIFKETLSNNHMGNLAEDFLMASGKLQALCYKADIEAALRTKGMAGFQLLDLHDFPGQGTALVGVLDAFWDEKGYISPESFRKFCNETVPLARFPKRVYSNNESAKIEIEAAHFGEQELEDAVTVWRVTNKTGESIYNGVFDKQNIPLGNGYKIGNISIDLHEIQSPQKFTLEVNISDFSNTWDFWVYPAEPDKLDESEIFVTSEVDEETLKVLESGGKVLLNIKHGSLKEEKGGEIKVGFSSIFWNTAWTRNQAPHTLGILCDPEHPVFQEFPTEFHSNWQWWDLIHNSHAVILDYYSEDLNPIVRIIDDWFENRRLGLLFETKVGNGKMMISGVDFSKDLETKLGKGQFLYSIKKYMLSSEFKPKIKLKIEDIKSLLKN